jgi:serine/threonine protein phosphatase PrpC
VSEKIIKDGLKLEEKESALDFLIDSAFAQGAPDNVTVVIADIESNVSPQQGVYLGAAIHE